MRIVGGKHRSRIINAPEGLNTRPSLDKTREAIFNIIAYYVYDANVLDIFSGSGALALEAISRGARKATLIDNNIDAIKCIKNNVELLKETDKCNVIHNDYSIIYINTGSFIPGRYVCPEGWLSFWYFLLGGFI